LLVNPSNPKNVEANIEDLQPVVRARKLRLHVLRASTEGEFDGVFAECVRLGVGGLVIAAEISFNNRGEQLAALALRHAVPAVHSVQEFPRAGGLMSYGGSIAHSHGQTGAYAGRILKGEKPGDLPVQQATKVELIINLKSAKALGLTVPLPLLGRADAVIE
jgi:putative ABC transport system substrate-binding protein